MMDEFKEKTAEELALITDVNELAAYYNEKNKYDREQLSQNSVGVPSSWGRILPPPSKDYLHYLLMLETEEGWRFDYEGGYLLYTQDRGLQRVKHEML